MLLMVVDMQATSTGTSMGSSGASEGASFTVCPENTAAIVCAYESNERKMVREATPVGASGGGPKVRCPEMGGVGGIFQNPHAMTNVCPGDSLHSSLAFDGDED